METTQTLPKNSLTLLPNEQDNLISDQLDLNKFLQAENGPELLQNVDRITLYQAISSTGIEDCLELLPMMSEEQWTTAVDMDAWMELEGVLKLNLSGIMPWLEAFRCISPTMAFERFKELEEEYQIGFLLPYIETTDLEAYEKLPYEEQDQYTALPGQELYYKLTTTDGKLVEMIDHLIEGGLAENLPYTISLLSHANALPPNEQEALITQFRIARLEEDGFVSFEEANKLFLPLAAPLLAGTVAAESKFIFTDAKKWLEQNSTVEEIDGFYRTLTYTLNAAASAARVAPDRLSSLRKVAAAVRNLLNLALEAQCGQNIEAAGRLLKNTHPSTLFKQALGLVEPYRQEALEWLKSPRMSELYALKNFSALPWLIDRDFLEMHGFETCEHLKAIFNRFPMVGKVTGDRLIYKTVGSLQDLPNLLVEKNIQ